MEAEQCGDPTDPKNGPKDREAGDADRQRVESLLSLGRPGLRRVFREVAVEVQRRWHRLWIVEQCDTFRI